MRIQHNVTALNAYRNLRGNNLNLAKNLEKLSSGYKINRAGDDAAGLAVSEKMRAQITGLEAATKNAQDGISLVQTAEGALTEVHSMLNRMVTLATQSANGTYDNEVDRANLQKEVASLKSEINRISESSNYNGIKLLDGSLAKEAIGAASNLPNVTVNGVTGQAAGAADDVIELKKAGDYRFSGYFDIKTHMTNNNIFTANPTNVGDTVKFKLKFNDKSGEEHIIEMNFVQGDATGKLDKAKSSVLLDGKALKNENVFKDATFNAAMTGESAFVFGAAKILEEVEPFSELFDIETLKAAGAAGGAVGDAECLGFKAKQESGEKAEVVSFLTNKHASPANVGNMTLGDTKLTLRSKKYDDSITVHGVKMFGLAKGKAGEEELKRATIEVNGEKFLFVTSIDKDETDVAEAIKKSGIKNIIYSDAAGNSGTASAMAAKDVKAMVKLINKTLGEEVAKVGTTDTDIVFDGKNDNGSSEVGLSLQIGDTADKFNKMFVAINSMSTASLKIKDIDISNQDGASNAIGKIKNAINSVSSTRGDLGALQNRLEHTINNLGVMHENITEAESRIRDTDMAKEMMAYTKNNILVQSATAMLAQANQLPQSVLQLLQ